MGRERTAELSMTFCISSKSVFLPALNTPCVNRDTGGAHMIVPRYLGVDATGIATSTFRKFGITTFVDHQDSTHTGGARVSDHHVMDADYLSYSIQATARGPTWFYHGSRITWAPQQSYEFPCFLQLSVQEKIALALGKRSQSTWVRILDSIPGFGSTDV